MPKNSVEGLENFLSRQEASTLAAVLLELSAEHEAVQQRLERMRLADQPAQLAASFRRTLTAWRRSTKFYDYRESSEFAQRLHHWLDQVERELAPIDPRVAVTLFESFIEADGKWFESADDSDAYIGDAVRTACRYWLEAAALCEAPPTGWSERLVKLFQADGYGAREELLRFADLLLGESALRKLVALFESRMADAVSGASEAKQLPHEVFKISAALSLLSEALRDPDVKVRAVQSYSPQPNALQRQDFARAYLDADRPEDALPWLQGTWGDMEDGRQSLLADVLGRLGRFDESAPIRRQLFERTLSVFDLNRWLDHLPEAARPEALSHARQIASKHNPTSAAILLMELGDANTAEARLIVNPACIDGRNYVDLAPLAKGFRTHGCWRGEVAIYRALLGGILDRAYARAYEHAARYWSRLQEVAATDVSLMPLQSHENFEAEIRLRHKRKSAFWEQVASRRVARPLDEED